MIKDPELAKKLNSMVRDVCAVLDNSASLVNECPEPEAMAYKTAVGNVFLCICSSILEPLYEEHPEIAPAYWNDDPQAMV